MTKEFLAAIRARDFSLVERYINQGVEISYKDEFGQDALFYSIVYPQTNIFNLLLAKGADVKAIYKGDKNLLHIAVESDIEKKGYFEIVQLLLSAGVSINAKDKFGNTPLWYACIYYVINKKTIEILLKNGADITTKNSRGVSIYESAKKNNRLELLAILEKNNADNGGDLSESKHNR